MAFVVEDGTGKPDANSYAAVAEADAYFQDRGISGWTGTNEEKQTYLIRATDYMDGRFCFKGKPTTDTQALSWPRTGVDGIADNEIPVKLKRACFEYALRAKTALAPDPNVDASGMVTIVKRQKVGPIEREFEAVQSGLGSTVMLFRPYPAADMLLRGLVCPAGTGCRVIR